MKSTVIPGELLPDDVSPIALATRKAPSRGHVAHSSEILGREVGAPAEVFTYADDGLVYQSGLVMNVPHDTQHDVRAGRASLRPSSTHALVIAAFVERRIVKADTSGIVLSYQPFLNIFGTSEIRPTSTVLFAS